MVQRLDDPVLPFQEIRSGEINAGGAAADLRTVNAGGGSPERPFHKTKEDDPDSRQRDTGAVFLL